MKIATYNVNGITSRLAVVLRWLEEAQPDIVCLQELKTIDRAFPRAELEAAGYVSESFGQPRWNGVALLSRVGDIHVTRRGLPDDPDPAQSRYIEAAINGVIVAGLYLPNGNPRPGPKFAYKLRWFEALIAHAASLIDSGLPVVLLGDFNVMPTELDVRKPERWTEDALYAPEVRAAYARLVAQGWTDSLRSLHPEERIYTFWHYWGQSFERDDGLRIDHVLLSPSLSPRLRAAEVAREPRGWDKTSDHAPVWIEIGPPRKRKG